MKIILIGYMGSGKSIVGKTLAETINFPFLDLDVQIETLEKRSITELFNTKGEVYFRKKERQVLENTLLKDENFVLSVGGGTPCLGDTMEYLNKQHNVLTIYLQASNETLTNRLFDEKDERPLIQHISTKTDLNDFIRKHLFERNFYYNQAAKKIRVDDKEVTAIVAEIVAGLF